MAKKYPKSEIIQNASAVVPEEAYVTWGDDLQSKQDAITKSAGSLEEFVGIHKAEAAGRRYSLDYSKGEADFLFNYFYLPLISFIKFFETGSG